ncbi:MAG: pyridoxamine 5'-phosphate oxidase family protein [Treponema sp.]|nr:pyridoxamine 5'-phosphate oxidase family protein [Treponema sp.]
MDQKVIAKAEEIVASKTGGYGDGNGSGYCVLALIDDKGYPTASTISISKADGIKWLTFCAALDDNKAKRVKQCNRGSVCVNSSEYNITLVGTLEIMTDPGIKKEMWNEGLEGHFSGADDPNYCILRFNTERYNLFVDEGSATGILA